ncbi:MAG: heavy metal translocating P-type ATPase metal-binding domain-containing protein [Flavobacteriaceae bacterium]|nr:heavy metal translocating P-type ATPase metal-binding domain-containing protein [Flavobacteriaceae bacterium]
MHKNNCYHCGSVCKVNEIKIDDKLFCCHGCKTVYEILNQNELSCYYDLQNAPGTIPTEIKGKFDYLDNDEIASKIIEFNDSDISVVNFYIPNIHCSSCIWVLENLHKLNKNVITSLVNFPKKEVRITFNNKNISLKEVVELITSIAYEPYISLDDAEVAKNKIDRKLIYQVAVAGFAFGNVMLLSFPEYFQMDEYWLNQFKPFFRALMLLLAVPALVYSAKDYLISAYKGLKHGILNIDVPISLGILVLFFRSSYEIFSQTGQGYFDSLTGLIFFLLLGKIFQQKTYGFLSFERDYKSYFPIAVTKVNKDKTKDNIAVHNIKKGDRLLIRNEEIIPVDGILLNGNGLLDYSFVTGESIPVIKISGDKVYAGGKQMQGAIEIEVLQGVEQSYLTQLWSNDIFQKNTSKNIKSLTDSISKHFTIIILSITFFAGIYWYIIDETMAFQVVSAILIIACPCALALSAPFALGNMIRIFGREKFYLKNTNVIEAIAKIKTLVFDKTGTITTSNSVEIAYFGKVLSPIELCNIKSILRGSNHPLSRILYDYLIYDDNAEVSNFHELLGKGLTGTIDNIQIKIGSSNFVASNEDQSNQTSIYIKFDNEIKGKYIFNNTYRKGLKNIFLNLSKHYKIAIITGDNTGEKEILTKILPPNSQILFHQKPEDKLKYIKSLQNNNQNVMMLGDGLNDAGALVQSNVGISVSENINVFSPACDAILDANNFNKIPAFIALSKKTISIIKISFAISFLYNIIGLLFAISGNLTPIVAAILMPISSITVVIFATITTNIIAKKILS